MITIIIQWNHSPLATRDQSKCSNYNMDALGRFAVVDVSDELGLMLLGLLSVSAASASHAATAFLKAL